MWWSNARGIIALIDNNAQTAKQNFQTASELAANIPLIDENTRLAFKQRLAFSDIRLGNGPEAERLFRELIAAYSQSSGPDSPDVLRLRLNLAQAFMVQNKNAAAVDETSEIHHSFVAKLGRDHELSMQVSSRRVRSVKELSADAKMPFGMDSSCTSSPSRSRVRHPSSR